MNYNFGITTALLIIIIVLFMTGLGALVIMTSRTRSLCTACPEAYNNRSSSLRVRNSECVPLSKCSCGPSPKDDWKSVWYDPTVQNQIASQCLVSYDVSQSDPYSHLIPSKIYNMSDLNQSLEQMMKGLGDFRLLGEDTVSVTATLCNIAAFLSQCMAETILYDACDENNWSQTTSDTQPFAYPFSAACGQGGSDYMGPSYDCPEACPIDPSMKIVASTNAQWYGAPPPLFCAPSKTTKNTGYWNPLSGPWCPGEPDRDPYARPDEFIANITSDPPTSSCKYYADQKSGVPVFVQGGAPNNVPHDAQRTNVEGCCWWGRGAIQLTGRCNMGKLNNILKSVSYFQDGDDLCKSPEWICSSKYPTLKWIAGWIYWCSSVQSYDDGNGYNYQQALETFAKSLDTNKTQTIQDMQWKQGEFIYSVSGIVNRGCPAPGTSCDGWSHPEDRRMCYFQNILGILFNVAPPKTVTNCPH